MTTTTNKEIGEDIRRIRLGLSMTLDAFARTYEEWYGERISVPNLSKYERGVVRISAEVYERIKGLEILAVGGHHESSHANRT